MNEDYDAIRIANDATEFVSSQFGKHYIERLEKVRDSHYANARVADATNDYIAREIARADEIDREIGYFAIARQVSTDKKLLERVRESLKRKREKTDV